MHFMVPESLVAAVKQDPEPVSSHSCCKIVQVAPIDTVNVLGLGTELEHHEEILMHVKKLQTTCPSASCTIPARGTP